MKSVNEQFPDHPLPTRRFGDGLMVIAGCCLASTLISVIIALVVVYGGLDAL